MWVLTIFGQRISGAHYNPALSVAHMLRKDVGTFPRLLAIAYVVAQILGAFAGALIAWFLIGNQAGLVAEYSYSAVDFTNADLIPKLYTSSDSGNIYPNCDFSLSSKI